MVALASRSLDRPRVACFAYQWLYAAHDSLEAGDLLQAACQLRESVRLFLAALCEHYGVTPKRPTIRRLLKALVACPDCNTDGADVIRDILTHCNKAIRRKRVTADHLKISAFFLADMFRESEAELVYPSFAKGGRQ